MKSTLALLVFLAVTAPGSGYHVVDRWKPGGEGGWDYLTIDAQAHRLYFGRSTRVQVLDTRDGRLIGELPDTPGIHGVALVSSLGRGFTSNGRDSSVTIFDLATLKPISRVQVGRNPDAILYEPTTKRVFTMNAGSDDATAIDAKSGAVVGRIALGGRPEFAVADGKGGMFVNLEDSSAVESIDPRDLKVRARWPLAPGEEPSGLAIDVAHGRLFSVCSNKTMVVLDAATGKVLATPAIGEGPDGAAFDPGTGLAFSSNGGTGTLTVVHEDAPGRFTPLGDVPTEPRARTLALDPATHRIYLATAKFGEAPAPTAEQPRPRRPMIPGSFEILVLDR